MIDAPDRLLANGVAMAAARRKTGGLQWLPVASGATSRGSPELKPTGKRWGPGPHRFPA
jgi:hypothetical protein